MKITKLTLENFRSFKDKQTIEFAPVTLLFGPNSVGKSTVLMALFYIRHVLSKGDCNPQRIEELGDKYVGGFKGLVHGRDLDQTIRIGVEYSKGNSIGSSYTELRDLLGEDDLDDIKWLFNLSDASGTVEHVAIELAIDWSAQRRLAYVSECVIKLDKQAFATLKSSSGGQQAFIESINYLHPLLVGDEHDEWLEQCYDNQTSIHSRNVFRVFAIKGIELAEDIVDATEIDLDKLNELGRLDEHIPVIEDETFVSIFHETINGERIPETEFDNASYMSVSDNTMFMHAPIGFKSVIGAIPILGKALDTALDFDNRKEGALIVEIVSDAMVPAFDNLLTLLDDSLCIGPLRKIPDPTYQPNPNPQTKDWYDGLAAWDYLEKADVPFWLKVDHWMREKLDLGYGLSIKLQKSYAEYKKLNSPERVNQMEAQLNSLILKSLSGGGLRVAFDDSSNVTKYAIWDSNNKIEVSGCDIGVGVSQILPFIVAALEKDRGL